MILFEQFVAHIQGTMRDVFAFLGVAPEISINPDPTKQNSRAGRTIYHPWSKRFGRLVPDPVKNVLPSRLRLRLRATVNKLPTPEFDHTDLSAEQVSQIYQQLPPEIRALYGYWV
ncbi:hypothetical protein [Microvirga massiliensis]|uniref:hypothetical protein n=1 Tax=Microvirga massiliensis TaxID=1033741 RepID=UPI00062BCF2A|nr:hypothetical protein [Microvirga massiliensis]